MADTAVPYLIKLMERKDSQLTKAINRLSYESPLDRNLLPSTESQKAWIADALGAIGSRATGAIPCLLEASNDKHGMICIKAQAALMKIRQESVLPLVQTLSDTTSTNWNLAALLVGQLGEGIRPAIPSLLKALDDPNWKVRFGAAMALGNAHTDPERCLPRLIVSVKDSNPNVRATALSSLLRFGHQRKEASVAVIESLKDPDSHVRAMALFALENNLPAETAKEALPFVVKALNDEDELVREIAVRLLPKIAPDAAKKAGIK